MPTRQLPPKAPLEIMAEALIDLDSGLNISAKEAEIVRGLEEDIIFGRLPPATRLSKRRHPG